MRFYYDENKYPTVVYDENGKFITYERWSYIVDFISRRKNEFFIYSNEFYYRRKPIYTRKKCKCHLCRPPMRDVYAEFKAHYDEAMK